MVKALPLLRDAWLLAKPYFRSEEKWSAWLLLGSVVGLNLLMVGIDVVFNFWHGAFFNALQNHDRAAFTGLLLTYRRTASGWMPGFSGLAFTYILVVVYSRYLNQWLQIRWRRWLTERFVGEWLADRVYYRISLTAHAGGTAGTDNPDQRIAEDVRDFTGYLLALSIDLLTNIVTLGSFIAILWSLSGPMHVFGIGIPGYMVWAALLYAILGTWLTHLVGRPLAMLRFLQQRFEADFRFALVRLRENTEGVALYRGEREEQTGILKRFQAVLHNWWDIMDRTKLLNMLVSAYRQLAIIFPYVVAAPRYFSGAIALGGLMRTANAFGQVQGAMSWFVTSYAELAQLGAITERLATFHCAVLDARTAGTDLAIEPASSDDWTLRDLTLSVPGGQQLLTHEDLTLRAGESLVISGRSGSGKSTLFRALAGIWPYGTGAVERPSGTCLFLPQRPYIPLGTLRHAVSYPSRDDAYDDAAITEALRDAGLGHLAARLNDEDNWTLRLSGGEQQRLAVARALLAKPDWLFLDEATANLDPEAEADLYAILKRRLPRTTMISIAHRPSVARFHDRQLVMDRRGDVGRLLEAERVR